MERANGKLITGVHLQMEASNAGSEMAFGRIEPRTMVRKALWRRDGRALKLFASTSAILGVQDAFPSMNAPKDQRHKCRDAVTQLLPALAGGNESGDHDIPVTCLLLRFPWRPRPAVTVTSLFSSAVRLWAA